VAKSTSDVIEDLRAYSRLSDFPPVLEAALSELDRLYDSGNAAERERARAGLSEQQTEVLRLIAKGYSYREIARLLGIADGTVASHAQRLMVKVGAERKIELPVIAFRMGLT
jgi:DNA-binding NarL/FixJ family response regulator